MKTIGQRIRQEREAQGITRPVLAAYAKIGSTTLSDLELGRSRSTTALHKIAERLGLNPNWLETGKGQKHASQSATDQDWADITAYSQAAALGDGSVPDDYATAHKLKFKARSLQKKGLFANNLSVFYGSGDSMLPRIHDGDALLFDMADTTPRDGQIYIVRYDGGYFAKRLHQYGDQWFLVSDNTSDPKWRKPVLVDFNNGFEIIGRVRWIGSWEG
jgi:phage repressor protein C with HTH and peptisase S24 domain